MSSDAAKAPPSGAADHSIEEQGPLIETVVTTTGPDGVVNCAAMGVRWGEEELVFWPFNSTRTLRNLRVHGEAVVHLTDDVLLFVQAALGHPRPAMRRASVIEGSVIEEANSWREVVVTEITEIGATHLRYRARGSARTRDRGSAPGSWPPEQVRASRSACAAPATRPSRHRSWLRG